MLKFQFNYLLNTEVKVPFFPVISGSHSKSEPIHVNIVDSSYIKKYQ